MQSFGAAPPRIPTYAPGIIKRHMAEKPKKVTVSKPHVAIKPIKVAK